MRQAPNPFQIAAGLLAVALAASLLLTTESLPPFLATLFGTYPKLLVVQTCAVPGLALLVWLLLRCGASWWIGVLLAFSLWWVASLLWSAWPAGTAGVLARAVPYHVLAALAYVLASRPVQVRPVLRIFLAALVLAVLMQLFYLHQTFNRLPGTPTLQHAFFTRPVPFGNVNFATPHLIFGLFLVISIAVGAIQRRRRARLPAAQRFLTIHIILSVLAGVLFAFTFAAADSLAGKVALLAATAGYLLMALPIPRKRLVILLGCAVVFGAAAFVMAAPLVRGRALQWALGEGSTAQVRVVGTVTATDMALARPLLGWGAGTFAAVYPRFEPPGARSLYFVGAGFCAHPHSEPFRVLAELGLPGLFLFLAVTLGALLTGVDAMASLPRRERLITAALWAGLVGYLTEASFDVSLSFWDVAPAFWILCGLVAGYGRGMPIRPAGRPQRARSIALAALAAAVAGWWFYGVGGYRSQMHMAAAEDAFKAGKPDLARQHIERSTPHNTTPNMILRHRYRLAVLYMTQRRFVEASEQFTKVLDIAPDFLNSRLMLGDAQMQIGRFGRALTQLTRFVERRPENARGCSLLAHLLLRMDPQRFADDIVILLRRALQNSGYERRADARLLVRLLVQQDRRAEAHEVVEAVRETGQPWWQELAERIPPAEE